MASITNALFDAELANVPEVLGGPLTRTGTDTDLNTNPITPNEDIKWHVKNAFGDDVYISYAELQNPDLRSAVCREGLGERIRMRHFKNLALAVQACIQGNEATSLFDSSQKFLPFFLDVLTLNPTFYDIQPRNPEVYANKGGYVTADFTHTATGLSVDFAATLSDGVFKFIWVIDGVLTEAGANFTHVFPDPDTYTVSLLALGHDGLVVTVTKNITVTV